MQPIIRYILLTASRDWLFLGLMILIVIAAGISMFLGSTALSEQSLDAGSLYLWLCKINTHNWYDIIYMFSYKKII